MSSIDNRVVAMKFDDAQFQKGAQNTIKALSDLDKSLLLKNGTKGFADIEAASNRTRFGGISDAIDTVNAKFSGMQALALGVFATLGSKAVDFGQNMVANLTRSARDGFAEYELQLNSVQTILANTQASGATLDDVNGSLDRMNTYADQTIYNFQEMARNIGTFTAAGVDLKTSETSIKGIANLAALSGSNSQQASTAMYQLSQAISAGRVSLQDWNSVVNAGMGGSAFQRALAETAVAMGKIDESTLTLEGDMKNVKIAGESFRDSISGGDSWLDTDVLTAALSQFTGDLSDADLAAQGFSASQIEAIQLQAKTAQDAATQVKTFTQLMDVAAEATGSGWAKTWNILFGDLEEARTRWTTVGNAVTSFIDAGSDSRNDILQQWSDTGSRAKMFDALALSLEKVEWMFRVVKEAWAEVFPPQTAKYLTAISDAITGVVEKLTPHREQIEAAAAMTTKFAKALKNVQGFISPVFGLIGQGLEALWQGARIIGSFIGDIVQLGFAFGKVLVAPIRAFIDSLKKVDLGLSGTKINLGAIVDSFLAFKDKGIDTAADAISRFADTVYEFASSGGIGKVFEGIGTAIQYVNDVLSDFFAFFKRPAADANIKAAGLGTAAFNIRDAWQSVVDVFKAVWEFMQPAINAIKNFLGPIFSAISRMIGEMDFLQILAAVNTGIFAKLIWEVSGFVREGKGIFGSIKDLGSSLGEGLKGLSGAFKQGDSIPTAALKLGGAILLFAVSILLLVPAVEGLAGLDWDGLAVGLAGLAGAMGILIAASLILGKWGGSMIKTAASLVILAFALKIVSDAVIKSAELSWNEVAKGMTVIAGALAALVGSMVLLGKFAPKMMTSSLALLTVATALSMLAGVVAAMSFMGWEQLAKGGTALAGMLGLLVGAFLLIGLAQGSLLKGSLALMGMAAAINMLMVPILAMALIPWPVLLKGFGAVAILLALLAGSMLLLGANKKSNLEGAAAVMAMALALNLLTISVAALGNMNLGSLVQGILAVAAVMTVLVVAAKFMTTAAVGSGAMILMAGAMLVLAGAVAIFAAIPAGALFTAIGALALLMVVLAGGAAVMSVFAVPALILAGVLLALAVAMIGVSASMLIFAVAATGVAGGLMVLAKAASASVSGILPLMGLGAALLVFGAGLIVVGAGVVIFGAGLLILAAALAIIAMVGPLAAAGLLALALGMADMQQYIGAMLAVSATLLVVTIALAALGLGLAVFAIGLAAVAVAAIAFSLAIMIIAGALAIFGTVGPQAIATFLTFLTRLIAMIPIFAVSVATALVSFITTIASYAPQITAAAVQIITALLAGFNAVIPKIVQTVINLLDTLINALANNVPEWANKALEMVANFLQVLADNVGPIAEAGANLIIELLDAIGTEVPRIMEKGVELVDKLMDSIAEEVPNLLEAGADMIIDLVNGIADTIREKSTEIGEAGGNLASALIEGMVNGVTAGIGRIGTTIQDMANNAIDTAKNALGINSPSKVFHQFGLYIDEGLALGIDKGTSGVEQSMGTMANTTLTEFNKIIDSIAGSAQFLDMTASPVIRPVLDLTEVANGAQGIAGLLAPTALDIRGGYDTASSISNTQADNNNTDDDEGPEERRGGDTYNFNQTNNSPEALSTRDIYRDTQSLLALAEAETKD